MIAYIIGGIVALLVLYILFFNSSPCSGKTPTCYSDGTLASAGLAKCNPTTKTWDCPTSSCALTSTQYDTYSGVLKNTPKTGFACKDAFGYPNVNCGGQLYTNDVVAPSTCGGNSMPDPKQFCNAPYCFDTDGTFKCVPYCANDQWGCYMPGETMQTLATTMSAKLSCDGGNWDSSCGDNSLIHTPGGAYMTYDDPWTCSNGTWGTS